MSDAASGSSTIQMAIPDQAAGYCDPVTGMCVWPGAVEADVDAHTEEVSPTEQVPE